MAGQETAPGTTLRGHTGSYRIETPIGRGGFGTTHRARRVEDGRTVVVKQLRLDRAPDWKAIELFQREARILSQLDHPNIPEYLDYFELGSKEAPSGFAIVQSFVQGPTLQEIQR